MATNRTKRRLGRVPPEPTSFDARPVSSIRTEYFALIPHRRILLTKNQLVTLSMIASVILGIATAQAESVTPVDENPEWVERADEWNDFERWHFKVDGRSGYVVRPDQALSGNPWVWRARFPGFHAEMDQR